MSTASSTGTGLSIVLLLNRLTLGLYVLLSGVSKVQMGIGEFVGKHYTGLVPPWLPDWFATPYGYAVPVIEVLFGATLVLGICGRTTGWLVFLMLVSYTIALVGKLGLAAGGPGAFHTNFILITLSLFFAALGSGKISLDAVLWRKR